MLWLCCIRERWLIESDFMNLAFFIMIINLVLWMKQICKNMQLISGGCIHSTVRFWNYAFACMMKLIKKKKIDLLSQISAEKSREGMNPDRWWWWRWWWHCTRMSLNKNAPNMFKQFLHMINKAVSGKSSDNWHMPVCLDSLPYVWKCKHVILR